MRKILLLLLLVPFAFSGWAKVTPAALVGDNMVLQQRSNVTLWGTACSHAEVCVTPSWSTESVCCRADGAGNWQVQLPTPAGSFEPQQIYFDDSDGAPVVAENVLIGEVWFASGQSNMEMPLKGFGSAYTKGGFDEVAYASRWSGAVRIFTVPRKQSFEPCSEVKGAWDVPSAQTAAEFSAVAWHFATTLSAALNVPVGIVSCAFGGASVESWTSREVLAGYPDISLKPEELEKIVQWERPMLMYNAMFLPVKHYTVRGILWYQGCTNVSRYATYADRLVNMVELWRREMGQGELPFYAVEITPYAYSENGQGVQSARLREAQWTAIERIPNAAMISTNDLVEPYERFNIHPADKTRVGRRLCYLALNRTYGQKQFYVTHPRYKSCCAKGNEMWVAIETPDMDICRNYDIRGFELAGADHIFYPTDTVRLHWQTNEVVLSSVRVPEPVAVRYCFRDFAIGTLYGGNGLPLIPFRSDDWE